jgi:hypothetical protein
MRLRRLSGLTLVIALAIAAPASADVTLGSAAVPAGSIFDAASGDPADQVIAQLTDNPANPYLVPSTGQITQWQVNTSGSAIPGDPVTFVVLKPASGGSFTVVGVDARTLPSPLPSGGVATFPLTAPIAVTAGETLGLFSDSINSYWHDGSIPTASTLVALSAPTAPAVTQTLTQRSDFPISPSGYTMNLAANFVPVTGRRSAALKRCKKKFKHDHKKRKKCKKKAKKLPV